MNTNTRSGQKQGIVIVVVMIIVCLCLVCVVAGLYVYLGPGLPVDFENGGVTALPPEISEGMTPVIAVSVAVTPTVTVQPTLTSPAAATIAVVTPLPASPIAAENVATPSPSFGEEPTLFPTATPEPTTSSGGSGVPAPRLLNHTNCEGSISTFDRGNRIEFRWTWTQRVNAEGNYYLEVRIGPRGASTLASTGRIGNEALLDPAQNIWKVEIAVSSFYRDTANDYEWQVAYMNNN